MRGESNPSRLRGAFRALPWQDLSVVAGIVALTIGAYLLHPSAACFVVGLALVLIGTRGSLSGG